MNIAIEQLQLDELKAFLREQAEDAFPDLKDEQRLNMLAEKWATNAEFCVCRDEKNLLVGMIAFYDNQPESGIAYIPHVYVSIEYRRNGFFTSMLDIVSSYVKEKGFHEIRLEVDKQNKCAQHSYQSNGFIIMCSSNSKGNSFYMRKQL